MTDQDNKPDGETRQPPICDFCRTDAHYEVHFFSRLTVSGPPVHVCTRCLEHSARFEDMVSKAFRVRITNLATGKHSTGKPDRILQLVTILDPTGRFKTITSAVRITAGSADAADLVCSRCRKPLSKDTPGAVSWMVKDGTRQAVRLYHVDCLPEDALTRGTWMDLEHLGDLDQSSFSLAAREILEQIAHLVRP